MKIKEIIEYLETKYPLSWQEDWDNSGLQLGNVDQDLSGILVAIDTTEDVIQEALEKGCNLVVTHHPLLFHPLKRISTQTYVERCVSLVLKHDLVLYAIHTNLDNSPEGVNGYWAERMGLRNVKALDPLKGQYFKIITYVPLDAVDSIRKALLNHGIGKQGLYDGTSFSVQGEGRFRPLSGASPHVGEVEKWHVEKEEMVSVLCAKEDLKKALTTLRTTHPYEEPAIDVIPILNSNPNLGAGVIGDLPEPIEVHELFEMMKSWQPIDSIAHSKILKERVQRIAYGGGACRDYMKEATKQGADIYITGEAKYNDFYDAQDCITLVTIGHYESELHTEEILIKALSQKNGTFALHRASSSQNPITYC